MYLNIALESGNLCADDPESKDLSFQLKTDLTAGFLNLLQDDTDTEDWLVDWERGLVYNFTEGNKCEKDPGLKPKKQKSVINMSMRGRCFGSCPTQELPSMFRNKRRKRNLQDKDDRTESKYFTVGGKRIDPDEAEGIDCDKHDQCYDMVEGKCCGYENCDCPIVSMSECNSTACDIKGGACCHSAFAELCAGSLACECYEKECGSSECCGSKLDVCINSTDDELMFPCQCYENGCDKESCCENAAFGVCGETHACGCVLPLNQLETTKCSPNPCCDEPICYEKPECLPSASPSLLPSTHPSDIPSYIPSVQPSLLCM